MLSQVAYDRFYGIITINYSGKLGYGVVPPHTQLGEMIVTLAIDYKITIPAEELFSKPRTYDDEGVYDITDYNITIAMLSNGSDIDFPIWGRPFLSQNYLVIDHASNGR